PVRCMVVFLVVGCTPSSTPERSLRVKPEHAPVSLLRYQSLATMTGPRNARGTPHQESSSMSDVKKDHSIGEGTGAVAGTVTGAAGGAVAGPVATAAGARVGCVVGAKAGDSIAEAINPADYNDYFEANYNNAPYHSSERDWRDYQPADQY